MKKFNLLKKALAAVFVLAGVQQASAVTSGVYTVGPGGFFQSLSEAITDIPNITGPLTLNILPGTYTTADWRVQIPAIPGTGAGNRLVIQGLGAPGDIVIKMAGNATENYLLSLDGASFVTIRNITFENTATDFGRVIELKGAAEGDSIVNCVFTSAGTADNSNAANVVLGTQGAGSLTGKNNVVKDNVINRGYTGIYMYGASASSTTDNNVLANNTVFEPRVYGIYAQFAGNLKIANNTVSGTATSFTHGIFLNYLQSGGDITGNTVTINTTTGTHFGIYDSYHNSDLSSSATIADNVVNVTVTSGTGQDFYNTYCSNIHVLRNVTDVKASTGVANPPTLMFYCKGSTASGNTFKATATGSGSITNSSTGVYNFMSYADNCVVRNNLFDMKATSGKICSGGYNFLFYATNTACNSNTFNYTATSGGVFNPTSTANPFNLMCYANNTTFDSNKVNITTTTGVIGHGTTGTTSNFNSFNYAGEISYSHNKFTIYSEATGTSYGIYGYYAGYYAPAKLTFTNDTFDITYTKSATRYNMGYYMAYTGGPTASKTVDFSNNVFNVNMPGGAGSYYNWPMFISYQSNSPKVDGNIVNINTTSGTVYATGYYNIYANVSTKPGSYSNNKINVTATTATVYPYYAPMYSAGSCTGSNNEYNINTTSGTVNFYSAIYQGNGNTFENNTLNATTTTGQITVPNYYSSGTFKNNTYNFTTTSGTIQNLCNYTQSTALFENNDYNFTTTSGTIYCINPTTSGTTDAPTFWGNRFKARSTTGSVYGLFSSSTIPAGVKMYNNSFFLQTGGPSYQVYRTSGSRADFLLLNNTFHSTSQHNTNFMVFSNTTSTSNSGKMILHNNVFSLDKAGTSNAVDFSDTAYVRSDYNLFYAPGNFNMRAGAPAVNATSLRSWRVATGRDMNSLIYDPGFVNAANGDLRPNAASPNSWALQGRGVHVAGDTADMNGVPRARDRFEGVPDLGAYEFTPTSTPPNAVAFPSVPSQNTRQFFLFGQDTVASIDWGATVPATLSVKQYTGIKAPAMTPASVERTFFYVDVVAPVGVYEYIPNIKYKDPWLGNIESETIARIAKSSNGGAWMGYNFTNGITDTITNSLLPANPFDSLSSKFTGVQNGRIGIRCFNAPRSVQHYDVTAFAAKLQWEEEYAPIGYQIVVDSVNTLDESKAQFSSVANWNPSGLTENTLYYVWIRTICGLTDTSAWTLDTFRTMITCHAPEPKLSSLKPTEATIYWAPVRTAISYEYVLDQSPLDPVAGTNAVQTTRFVNALKAGTEYYFHVRAHCSTIYEESDWATLHFITPFFTDVEDVNGNIGIVVYPNPVTDVLTLNLSHAPAGKGKVIVTDVTGKAVFTTEVSDAQSKLNIGNIPAGIYLLKYNDDKSSGIVKLNKQ